MVADGRQSGRRCGGNVGVVAGRFARDPRAKVNSCDNGEAEHQRLYELWSPEDWSERDTGPAVTSGKNVE